MAIPFSLYSFLRFFLLLVISLVFLRLVFRRIWRSRNLPPGPLALPIVGNLLQFSFSGETFESTVKKLNERYGPIFTLWVGSRPLIMIAAREVAHEALIQKGSVFADRPPSIGTRKIFTGNQHSINSAAYGPLWRSLRRNLVNEALRPSAINSFGEIRIWSIERLVENLWNEAARNGGAVSILEQFRTAVLCILLCMCFGSKPNEETVNSVQGLLREILRTNVGLGESLSNPGLFFQQRRARVVEIRRRQREDLLPLINKRRNASTPASSAYADTLLTLTVDGGRILDDDELLTLYSEFITVGMDTTSTSLQWLMANMVTLL